MKERRGENKPREKEGGEKGRGERGRGERGRGERKRTRMSVINTLCEIFVFFLGREEGEVGGREGDEEQEDRS